MTTKSLSAPFYWDYGVYDLLLAAAGSRYRNWNFGDPIMSATGVVSRSRESEGYFVPGIWLFASAIAKFIR